MSDHILAVRVLLALAVLAVPPPAWAQDPPAVIVSAHPILTASAARLAAGSQSWRDAMKDVAATARRAVLLTPEQFAGRFDATTLAQAEPVGQDPHRVDYVVVIVNLDLLQRLSLLPVTSDAFEEDIDRILAHEVYGHAVPYLLGGTMSAMCADPTRGQSAVASCAIQRENVIRREMRLGRRVEYGRESLALARRFRE